MERKRVEKGGMKGHGWHGRAERNEGKRRERAGREESREKREGKLLQDPRPDSALLTVSWATVAILWYGGVKHFRKPN